MYEKTGVGGREVEERKEGRKEEPRLNFVKKMHHSTDTDFKSELQL